MGWLWILLGGSGLFIVLERTTVITGNPNYIPTLLMLGAVTFPLSFVVYTQESLKDRSITLNVLMLSALWGGTIGAVVAGSLEFDTLRSLGTLPMVMVAIIEESSKLILPIALVLWNKYSGEAAGLLIGVAVGMGFAALETMGYGFAQLMRSHGNIGSVEALLLFRGLLSPAGHVAWTGLASAALWRMRGSFSVRTVLHFIGTFVLVIAMHAIWDSLASVPIFTVLTVTSMLLVFRELKKLNRPVRKLQSVESWKEAA